MKSKIIVLAISAIICMTSSAQSEDYWMEQPSVNYGVETGVNYSGFSLVEEPLSNQTSFSDIQRSRPDVSTNDGISGTAPIESENMLGFIFLLTAFYAAYGAIRFRNKTIN